MQSSEVDRTARQELEPGLGHRWADPHGSKGPPVEPLSAAPPAQPSDLVPHYALDKVFVFTRTASLHAVLTPVLWGTALAWWQLGRYDFWLLLLTLVGASGLYLGTNAFSCYYDYRRKLLLVSGRDIEFSVDAEPRADQLMAWGDIQSVAWIGYLFGLIASLWLTYLVGWPMLFFNGLSALIAAAYALPPLHLGYRGRGLGEIGLFLAFGYLPALAAFYAQSGQISWLATVGVAPLALFIALISLDYHFLNWRRDWRLRKQTPVVALQPQRALDISAVTTVLVYVALILQVGAGLLPVWSLLGLVGMPLALRPFARIPRHRSTHVDGLYLVRSVVGAAALTGSLLVLSLWLDRTF